MKKAYLENLNILNDPEYKKLFSTSNVSTEEAYRKKARYLKGQTAQPVTLSVDELKNMTNDDDVTLTGLFKHEVEIVLAQQPVLFSVWESSNIDVREIVDMAFKNFDTLRNSETYPMDDLCHQILVSECVRMYFEACLSKELVKLIKKTIKNK